MFSWFSTRTPKQFNNARKMFLASYAGATGYPHMKEWSWTLTLCEIQMNSRCFIDLHVNVATTKPLGFPCSSSGKESAYDAGDQGSVPGSGRASGEGNDNLLQYSCLENSMDREAWRATVHGVAKSRTWLSTNTHSIGTLSSIYRSRTHTCWSKPPWGKSLGS